MSERSSIRQSVVVGVVSAVVSGAAAAVFAFWLLQPVPKADFTCSPNPVEAGQEVTCTNFSANADEFVWRFGDTDRREVAGKVPQAFVAAEAGDLAVELVARGSRTQEDARYLVQIRVQGAERRFENPVRISAFGETAVRVETRERAVGLSQTKDDHPVVFAPHGRSYSRSFDAAPGYRIVSARFVEELADHASDIVAEVAPDGGAAVLKFRLTSGPQVSQYRGRLSGRVVLREERIVEPTAVPLAERMLIDRAGTYALSPSVSLEGLVGIRVVEDTGSVIGSGAPDSVIALTGTDLSIAFRSAAMGVELTVFDPESG